MAAGHFHECPKCNTVWKHHPPIDGGGMVWTHQQWYRAHNCPKCGYHTTRGMFTNRPPAEVQSLGEMPNFVPEDHPEQANGSD